MSIEPDTKLSYPIVGGATGSLFVYHHPNNQHPETLVLLCPGFPDDQYALAPTARQLADECDCWAAVMCLPGYETSGQSRGLYTFAEWRLAIKEAIQVLREFHTKTAGNTARLVGIFHDWGCLLGLQYTNQCLAQDAPQEQILEQMVLLDVLLGPHPKNSSPDGGGHLASIPGDSFLGKVLTALAILTYQLWCAFCWAVYHYISPAAALFFYQAVQGPAKVLGIFPVSPRDWDHLKECMKHPKRVIAMSYPYFYLWKGILLGESRSVGKFSYLPLNLKETPVLYLYGEEKNFHIHSIQGMTQLQNEAKKKGSRCDVIGIEGAGHWLHLQRPELCLAQIKSFLFDKR